MLCLQPLSWPWSLTRQFSLGINTREALKPSETVRVTQLTNQCLAYSLQWLFIEPWINECISKMIKQASRQAHPAPKFMLCLLHLLVLNCEPQSPGLRWGGIFAWRVALLVCYSCFDKSISASTCARYWVLHTILFEEKGLLQVLHNFLPYTMLPPKHI